MADLDQLFQTALLHHQAGRYAEAEQLYRQILTRQPHHAEVLHALGVLGNQAGQYDIAAKLIARAIALRPNFPEAHNNLGNALKDKGQLDEAVAAYGQAVTLRPNFPEAHYNLANALYEQGRVDEAIAAHRQAIALRPNFPEACANLGNALKDQGQLDEAIAAYRQAIALRPDFPEAFNNLGNALKDAGLLDEAIAAYRQAIALRPNFAAAGCNLVYALHFHPDHDASAIAEEARQWNLQYAEPVRNPIRPHENDRNPNRRLRIGYVSPDFREHPVGRFMAPLLAGHDHQNFEIFCYAEVSKPDALTQQLRSQADHWHSIVGVSDHQVAELIREHQIDILIDLTMHLDRSRLLVFARKPAPLAVTYLAYCSTTGLTTIDYRISDPFLDPPGMDESIYSERTVRLPETYWCYQPSYAPATGPVPAVGAGYITFGCLNNFCKITEPTLATWIRLLQSVPNSRLILHAHEGSHRQRTVGHFERMGIDPQRVRFIATVPANEYLQIYQQIDIALDPFPYGGGTTTCDALWMGVPIISLRGDTAVSRAGLSILSNTGLPELVAGTRDQYVQIAIDLANDPHRLAELRASLRRRMEQSPLLDAPRFARNIEAAYREMWIQWCLGTSSKRA